MSAERGYVPKNDAERARLEALVAVRSDTDLSRPMPDGWTVAGVLGHLAFWDQRILALLDRWERDGVAPPPHHEADVDWINAAAGSPLNLERAHHRREHLDEIERVLSP